MHKKIWFKVHLVLGLLAGIILLIVGITGAILSFEKEILRAINKDSYMVVIPNTQSLSTKVLLERFQVKLPDAKINSLSFSSDINESVVINIAGTGDVKTVRRGINHFVNPYTAEILPPLVGKEFFSFNENLHRWLAFGGESREIGKQVVAISTVALIILSITGVIIYWGRIKRSFFKSFTFTTKHHGRAFLSTMHSAVGMWVLPFYLLASLTGLYWSYEWYNTALYKIAGVEKPKRNMPKKQAFESKKTSFDSHQKAVEIFDVFVQKKYSSASVRFPENGTVYTFSYLDINPAHYRARNSLELDIESEQIIKHERYNDKPLNEKLMGSMLPLHSGEYFGRIGQIGMFIVSALMSLFTITGIMLYFKRKLKKKTNK
ncbi:MAG: PepSY domain-containing protein [Aliarcobacter sp.]|nr:PepSY domain-containing protein [Aliarcobacter sp.]